MTNSILYIDDEVDNLTIFKSRFRHSFNVITSESPQQGLDLIENNDVRVVISDQRMPEMTGVQFLERVKNRYPDVIRIVLTAYTDSDDIIDAINRGAVSSFIKKPWNSNEIQNVIEDSLLQYDLRWKSRNTVEHIYQASNTDSEQNVNTVLDRHLKLLHDAGAAASVPEVSVIVKQLLESFDQIKDIVTSNSFSPDQSQLSQTPGRFLVDEDLLYVMARFPERSATIHRLHFTNPEFRQLCRDYLECRFEANDKATSSPDEQREFHLLKKELEDEILTWLM